MPQAIEHVTPAPEQVTFSEKVKVAKLGYLDQRKNARWRSDEPDPENPNQITYERIDLRVNKLNQLDYNHRYRTLRDHHERWVDRLYEIYKPKLEELPLSPKEAKSD